MAATRLILRGRVQGVGFRWFAAQAARRTDLGGWVRNLADGGVEIAVAGEPGAIDDFVEVIRRGPPGARVDTLERSPLAAADSIEHPFAIRR